MKGFGRAGPVSRLHSRADQPENPVIFFRSAEGTSETDSPTEQRGFEPVVPRKNGWTVLTTLIDPKALLLRENQANSRERDRGFESVFLQRRVRCETDFRFPSRHPHRQLVIGRMLDPGSGDRLRPCDSAVRFRASCPSARRVANQSARPRPADASARIDPSRPGTGVRNPLPPAERVLCEPDFLASSDRAIG
jgi:hypothetical protein